MMADLNTAPVTPPSLLQPHRPGAILLAALIITLFFIAPAACFAWMSLTQASTRTEHLLFAALTIAFAIIPAWLLFTLLRRKARTGQWFITDEERFEARRRWASIPQKPWITRTTQWLSYLAALLWSATAFLHLRTWRTRSHDSSDLLFAGLYALCAGLFVLSARTNPK